MCREKQNKPPLSGAHRWHSDGLEYIRLHSFTIESWESRSNRPVQVMSHLSLFEQSVMFDGFTANLEHPTQHPGSSDGLAWFQMELHLLIELRRA